MSAPNLTSDQNLLPVQAYFDVYGNFQTFIGQGQPFYATLNPSQSGLNITNSTINSTTIGLVTPSTGIFTNIQTTTGSISTTAVNPTDIVNKSYVDAIAQGLSFKAPAQVATTANITLSGLQTIDGYTTLAGDRVLVKNQTTQANNGIYIASTGTWARSSDANTYAELVSAFLFVENGAQSGSAWVCTSPQNGTLGVTAITFTQFSNTALYTAGTGLTLSGYQFSITPQGTAGTYGSASSVPVFVTNASGQITSVTNTSISIAPSQINATIPNFGLTNSSLTVNGTLISLGGSGTITATASNALTIGTGLSGTSYNGSTPVTVAIANTSVTSGSYTLGNFTVNAQGQLTAASSSSTTGSGNVVLATSPTLVTPNLGTPSTLVGTNITGTASALNIGGNAATATSATSATTATNLASGTTYALPYQSGVGTTSFLASSTAGQVLITNGSSTAPSWASSITLTSGSFGTLYTTGLTGYLYGNGAGAVTASTTIPTSALSGQVSLANGGTNANLTANAGGVVYSGASALAISTAGTTGQYLTSNGTGAPTWSTPSASVTISDQTVSSSTFYPAFLSATSGTATTIDTSSTKLQYVPSTGTFTATVLNAGNHVATGSTTGSANTGAFSYGTLGYSDTNILASFQSSVNTYNQMVLQNTSSGATASTNFNVSNNNATATTNFGEFGINSSGFTGTGAFSTAGYVYLASASTDLAIGTYGSNSIHFVTNSSATDAITINTSNAVAFNGSYGTSGYLLQSNGSGSAPTWVSTPSGTTITDDTTTNATRYPLFSSVTSGTLSTAYTSSTEFQYNPSTGTLISPILQAGTGANYIQSSGNTTGNAPVVQALGSDTNIPLVLQPKGTGALQAQQTTSTVTGGNARGANAVDWQTNRNAATQVANGSQAVIAGGQQNTASATQSSILGGSGNNVSNAWAVIGGGLSNAVSGATSFNGAGQSNTTAGARAAVVTGRANAASGEFNFIGGGYANSGTATAAVTTQATSIITSGSTAVTLSATNAAIKVGQFISGTPIPSECYVAAISGTSLTLSQNATSSTNATLSFYTPHGVVVGGGNNQATGSYSFVGGGGDAGTSANRNVASGDWSFVGGGQNNIASGVGSVISGGGVNGSSASGNTASGNSSGIVSGTANLSSAQFSFVGAGRGNLATGTLSSIINGRQASTRSINGANSQNSAYFSVVGDGQIETFHLLITTTTATTTELTTDGSSPGSTNIAVLPPPSTAGSSSVYTFRGIISAKDQATTNAAGWEIKGVIQRTGSATSTTSLVGTPTITLLGATSGITSTWGQVGNVTVTADTTYGGISVNVTGAASTTIRWNGRLETSELG